MPAPLRCPTCSAPLDLPPEHATTVRCPYCGAGVLLTERGGNVQAAAQQARHSDAIAEVLRMLRAGNRIGAIKAYRDRFGTGLKESKEAVERLEAGQPHGSVPLATTKAAGSPKAALGCALLAMAVAVLAGVLLTRGGDEPEVQPAASTTPSAAVTPEPAKEAPPPQWAEQVLAFGGEGTGAGRFEDARSVAVDGAGRIYVGEYSGGRIQVFDSAGTFVTQWFANRQMPLRDVAADRSGTVYVVQSGRIHRYDGPTGESKGELARVAGFGSYDDVALALDGSLWAVDDVGNKVVHLSREGRVLRSIDLREVIGERATPARVAVAGSGDVYVLDQWTPDVYHLDPNGRFVDRFGGKGDGPGRLQSPEDVVVDGRGRVYVSDFGEAIEVYDAAGNSVATFGGTAVVFGMAVSDRDELFATFRNDTQVVKFRLPK